MVSCNMFPTLVLCFLGVFVTNCHGEDMCYSVFDGNAYPHETCYPQTGRRTLGHTLQWSQAISKAVKKWFTVKTYPSQNVPKSKRTHFESKRTQMGSKHTQVES